MAQSRPQQPRYSSGGQYGAPVRPVSSFYGEGGQYANTASNRDSYLGRASNRGSMMLQDMPPGAAAGYGSVGNRQSGRYSQVGQDDHSHYQNQPYNDPYAQQQPDGRDSRPDLYADFNGMGPRYASRLSSSADMYAAANGGGYSPTAMDTQTSLLEKGDMKSRQSMAGGELLSAPVLGKDWDSADESRKSKLLPEKTGFRGPGLFATAGKKIRKAFVWKRFIFIFTGLLCVLAVVLYFVIPRVPTLQLNADTPLTAEGDGNANFTRIPTVMQWQAQLNVAIDSTANWVPIHFSSFQLDVYDPDTFKKVGTGNIEGGRTTFPGRTLTPTMLDVNFNYKANNDSDQTWLNFYNACAHKYSTTKRPGLNIVVQLQMGVRGIIGTHSASTTVTGLDCPIEVSSSNA